MRSGDILGKVKISGKLVKFDGDPPKNGEDKEPTEIIEVSDDKPPVILYRKDDPEFAGVDYRTYMPNNGDNDAKD